MKQLPMLYSAPGIALLVAALQGFALVVVFLALAESNDELDKAAFVEQLGRYDRHTVFFAGL